MSKCGDKAYKTYFQSSENGLELTFSIKHRTLYEKKNVVTSDSIILDRCCSWVNMTAEIMEQKGKYGLRVWE